MNVPITEALPILVGLLLKTTLLLSAAGLACRLLRCASAATRHLVWTTALGAVLLLPSVSGLLPRWNVAWWYAAVRQAPAVVAAPPPPPAAAARALPDGAPGPITLPQAVPSPDPVPPAPAPPRARPRPPISRAVLVTAGLAVWLLGSLAVLVHLVVGLGRIGRIRRRAAPLDAEETVATARRRLGLRRPVAFLRAGAGSGVTVPVTWGVLSPVVLLPPQSASWPVECLRAALLHELAHVGRGDWAAQLLGRLACALYWWHPLVWLATRRAREEAERACDDRVLGAGMSPTDYAQRLVDVVRVMPTGRPPGTVAVAMARPSEVEGRVRAVLDRGRDRRPLTRRLVVGVACLSLLVVLPLAALRPVARAQAGGNGGTHAGRPVPRGILAFVYLNDVRCPARPNLPLRLDLTVGADGHETYTLTDGRARQVSRDPQTVQADFRRLLAQGYRPRAGAAPSRVPPNLSADVATREVFFTPAQRREAAALSREKAAFLRLLDDSPVIVTDADVERAEALTERRDGPALGLTFTPDGARRMRAFTAAHKGSVMGILIDGDLLFAPIIMDAVGGGDDTLTGFRDPAAVRSLAERLNASTPRERVATGYPASRSDDIQIRQPGEAAAMGPPLIPEGPPEFVYGFRRYVSPPLPDGTRFTFLYPAFYTQVGPDRYAGQVPFWSVWLGTGRLRPVLWAAARGQTPVRRLIRGSGGRAWPAPYDEFVSVVVGRAGEVSFPIGVSALRRDTRWVGANGSHHAVAITDRRSDLRFLITHEDRSIPALFGQTDPVLFGSFRILPPGVGDGLGGGKWPAQAS